MWTKDFPRETNAYGATEACERVSVLRLAVASALVLVPFAAAPAAAWSPSEECVDTNPPKVDPEPCAIEVCALGSWNSGTHACAGASMQTAEVSICVDETAEQKCVELVLLLWLEDRPLPYPVPVLA